MNINTSRGLAAAGLLAATVGAMAVTMSPAQAASTDWKTERGIVVECHGTKGGMTVRTTVYENNRYGNVVQVGVGDPDLGKDAGRTTEEKFLVDGALRATVKVDGKRAVVKGTAVRYGARTPVSESFEDAGFTIQTRGFQRQLRTDLVAKYDGKVVPLTCDTAFYYDLEVKKTPIA